MTHALKTWKEYYKAVETGEKTFELRKADRPFKVGDTLLLQEWDWEKGEYTGKETSRRITYVLTSATKFGLMEGYCILGMKEIEQY